MKEVTSALNDELELEKLKASTLDHIPQGVVIVNNKGIIEYVNPAIGVILGSTKTVGLNILEFNTVRCSNMYEAIIKGLNGIYAEFYNEDYTSYTTSVKKKLNIFGYPIIINRSSEIYGVMLHIHDITEEYELKKKVQSTYISTIAALAEAIDARDEYTGEHSKNVSRYVKLICRNLNISNEQRDKIETAASVHDIGKIGIRDYILNKPDKLTSEEYEIMKQHPVIGWEIIGKVDGFDDISLIIKHHHERWDGKGYPDGLLGNIIPLGAQVIAIADTYDAITSNRVYRKSLGKDKALQILLEERGKQFNEELVNIFINELYKLTVNNIEAI